MDYKEVIKLVDKFFEGETSLKEEKLLKDFFENSKDIPSDLLYAKDLFNHMIKESKETVDTPVVRKDRKIGPRRILTLSGIAAGIIILIGLVFFTRNTNQETVYAYYNGEPITDQEQAYKETYKAINLLSKNLNRGTADLSYLNKINKIETLIKK